MKVLILNGSPRKGNTLSALEAIAEGIKDNLEADIEFYNVSKYKIEGCLACDYCKTNNGKCVNQNDAGQFFADKIEGADVIIFGSPVYWWGISAQLKSLIDRIYMKSFEGKKLKKKIGVLAVGADELENEEYELISRQFRCICDYVGWEVVLDESISAFAKDEVNKNEEKIEYLKTLWKYLK